MNCSTDEHSSGENTKWDDTPPPLYTNEDVSFHKYSKHHDNTYMDIMINNGSIVDIHICPFDLFQRISSFRTIRSDQNFPVNSFYCV